jgi:DNA repair exonuclease SbcCD ATPase subunit
MKIISLTAENVKRLKAVHIEPDPSGNLVIVSGANAQGKTSVLDSIWLALGGAPAGKATPQPIRDGETYASVTLDLGDLVVTRSWSGDKPTTLKVASKDGAKYSSPQTMLDSLVGRLSFDPLEFAQQDQKSQRATLLSLVDLPFDPDELDAKRRGIFDRRTDVGRRAKSLTGQLDGMPPYDDTLPAEEESLSALLDEARVARDQVALFDRIVAEQESAQQAFLAAQDAMERAKQRMNAAEDAYSEFDASALVDPTAIEARIQGLEQTNREIRAQQQRRLVKAEHDEAVALAKGLTEQIQDLDAQRTAALAEATMPLPGLSFDDDGVTYQDVPLKQASAAEQLRVSIAMAMALNPKVRVIRITDGSLLDSHNLALIEAMAVEHDFQVWVERVDESGQVGIVIEDGQVVEQTTAVSA